MHNHNSAHAGEENEFNPSLMLEFKLRRSHVIISQKFNDMLDPLKIRPTEFSALTMIARFPGEKQTSIARKLGVKRANFVFLMDALEQLELAERRQDGCDRRSHSLYLTEKGHRIAREADLIGKAHNKDIAEQLHGQKNLDQLLSYLDLIIEANAKSGSPLTA